MQRIKRDEFMVKVLEMQKALEQMSDSTRHYICPACLAIVNIDPQHRVRGDLRCWCNYDSGDIEY